MTALHENAQVGWIADDDDVAGFFRKLYEEHGGAAESGVRNILFSFYPKLRPQSDEDEEFPF